MTAQVAALSSRRSYILDRDEPPSQHSRSPGDAPGGRERLRTEIAAGVAEAGLPTLRSAVNRVIGKQLIGNAGLTGAPVALTI